MPINFDREFTCLSTLTLHSSLISFKFRPRKCDDSYSENGIIVIHKNEKENEKSDKPIKLKDFLFGDDLNAN